MAALQTTNDKNTRAEERQELQRRLQAQMQLVRFKVVVLSGKAGVGKSTVAANLAVVLADQGHTVGLLDVDIHGPSIPKLLGITGEKITPCGGRMLPVHARERLWVISAAFLMKSTDAVIWRGPLKFHLIQQFLSDVAWGALDFLVIDSPPGTGDEPLSVAQLVGRPAAAVMVTTPQDVAVNDVRRCVTFCRETDLPVAGIVENTSGYVCPQCGSKAEIFGSGGGRRLADEMKVPFLGQIPLDAQIVSSGDGGVAFVSADAKSASRTAFIRIVNEVEAFTQQQLTPVGDKAVQEPASAK
ncbi:MAG: Mrp/NBP35 family ATP-binding protein [Acidobacteriia bacterium]|nr:Mrp/NBP35 family ATP-binding protein [Terriglobia bacterium]